MERKLQLEEYRDKEDCIKVVDYWQMDMDTEQGQELFADPNKTALDRGYEGPMIKFPTHEVYKCKRSSCLVKNKVLY